MLVLLGDWRWGCVPLRRKDLGWSVIFLETYAMWAWLIMFNTGRCPYDMFDFGTGWTEGKFILIFVWAIVLTSCFVYSSVALRRFGRDRGVSHGGEVDVRCEGSKRGTGPGGWRRRRAPGESRREIRVPLVVTG